MQVAKAILDDDDKALAAGLVKLGYLDRAQDPKPMLKVIHILFEPMFTRGEFDPTSYVTVKKAKQVGELALENKLVAATNLPGPQRARCARWSASKASSCGWA